TLADVASAFLGRSGRKICRPPGIDEQAAKANAITTAAASAAGLRDLKWLHVINTTRTLAALVDDFNLLWPCRIDRRATSLFYPAAHFSVAASQRLRCQPSTRKNPLFSFETRDGEGLRQTPPKIHKENPATVSYGRYFTLHQRESSLFGKNIHRVIRVFD